VESAKENDGCASGPLAYVVRIEESRSTSRCGIIRPCQRMIQTNNGVNRSGFSGDSCNAALGGHLLQCPACVQTRIAYNCRNRHCPKRQAGTARRRLEARQTDFLPVEYYHVVFTLPGPISDIAWHNKSLLNGLMFQAEALLTKHLSTASTGRWCCTRGARAQWPSLAAWLPPAVSSLEACKTPAH